MIRMRAAAQGTAGVYEAGNAFPVRSIRRESH